jgi:hypothetical protein
VEDLQVVALPVESETLFYFMKKDAFYFPHFANARHDRKLKRVQKELGLEGYAIYFQLLEILREQLDFKYPLSDIDLLADEMGTSEPKVKAVIGNYDLFTLDEEDNFFSIKQLYYLQPYIEKTQRARIAANKRWDKVNDDANAMQMHSKCNADAMQGKESKVKESKIKESKLKDSKEVIFPFDSDKFKNYWSLWVEYKKVQHNFTYKSPIIIQSSLNDLVKLSKGNEEVAIKIIDQSISKSWKGFFELKNENNASTNNNSRVAPKVTAEQLHEAHTKFFGERR